MDPQEQLKQLTPEQRKQLEEKLKNMTPEQLKELQKQQCIFCQIVSGKIPSKKLYEDEFVLAILDINPAARGHVLLLPKEHYSLLPQMPEKEIGHLYLTAKKLSQVLLKALRADGTTLFLANGAVAGQRAPHVMLHLIPRKEGDGGFPLQEKILEKSAWETAKEAIREKLGGLQKEEKSEEKKEEDEKRDQKRPIKKNEESKKKEEKKEEKKVNKENKEKERNEVVDAIEEETEEEENGKEEETNEEEAVNSEKKSNSEKKEDVTLDDIANLFK